MPEFISFDRLEFREPRFVDRLMKQGGQTRLLIDRRGYQYESGAWAYWVPELRCKFLHSREGRVHCIYKTAPKRDFVFDPALDLDGIDSTGRYNWSDWRAIYGKTAVRRVAEIYIATQRLHAAGLGPKALGICRARNFVFEGTTDPAGALGISTEDAMALPKKEPATEPGLLAAGVLPDRIRSCIRQQVNGYVVDLNSVIGVVPIDAEEEVAALEHEIAARFS